MSGVTERVLNVTVLYLAEHKGQVANEEDNRIAHLLLVNLGFAWEALSGMQREFRERFGALFDHQRVDELEAHERSNFRHLWAVSFAMRHERQRHLSDVCHMVETEIERRKVQFLQALKVEIDSALHGTGSAIVQITPWLLDGIRHLCIACDHRTVEGLDARLPDVVSALWRAAQTGGWREMEWKPLEVEWPRIALVNLVRGKALLAAHATISTASLFVPSDTFQVKPHHYTALPVNSEDFASSGFSVWESPLVRVAVALHGNVLAFVVTHSRFYQLSKLILEQELKQTDTDRILARFSSEVKTVLNTAQRSYAAAMQILSSCSSPEKARWLEELKRLCSALLFEVDEDASLTLTLETFTAWAAEFETANGQFQRLVLEIVTFALAACGNE